MSGFVPLLFLAVTLLGGCSLVPPGTTNKPAGTPPTTAEQPIITPHRGYRTIDIWLDATTSTPRQYFDQAKEAGVDAIDQAVMPNSDWMTVWSSLISHNSYHPESLVSTIVIPKIDADPPGPEP